MHYNETQLSNLLLFAYWLSKTPQYEFNENPFSGSRIITADQQDMAQRIGTFLQIFITPKMAYVIYVILLLE
jgi:hypothetical protein